MIFASAWGLGEEALWRGGTYGRSSSKPTATHGRSHWRPTVGFFDDLP
ncbi:hypothetical protein HMPREF1556_01216 [Porphyromonas sp. oral taxon 278 str. W7784]|nr:hypothetical protein HMPREF1556_01216 [Porphyromonas sp. oral taxon 278 str. W7784]